MTERETPREEHLTDEEIVAQLDEPAASDPTGAGLHLEACAVCRDRLAEMERVFVALRAEPPMPGETEFAGLHARVMAAIEARSRKGAPAHSIRRWWWAPLTAAAVAIGLLVLAPDVPLTPPPDSPADAATGTTPTEGIPLPVVAQADRAAEGAFRAVAGSETIGIGEAATVRIEAAQFEAAIAALDAATPSALTAEVGWNALEDEFAALSAGDQTAILDELSTMTFDL